jgi:hypothetical protein
MSYYSSSFIQAFDGGPSSNTDDEASSTTRNSSNRISSSYRIKDRNISSSDQVSLDHLFPQVSCGPESVLFFSSVRIRIRDGKKKSGSGMNIPDNFSKNLETFFWVKNA